MFIIDDTPTEYKKRLARNLIVFRGGGNHLPVGNQLLQSLPPDQAWVNLDIKPD